MNRVRILAIIIVLNLFLPVFASDVFVSSGMYKTNERKNLIEQLGISTVSPAAPDNASLIAIANADYPVTPGDVYTLTYINSNESEVSIRLQVDANYNVTVPYAGVINAKGMTFLKFKDTVISTLNAFYAYLNPQLDLVSCGIFEVYVYGEVKAASKVMTWSFARLSNLCSLATDYASTRKVLIEYPDGENVYYDLYKAVNGDDEQDPYLVPGCKVKFEKAEKTVFVQGNVKRPGQYQITGSPVLEDIINQYADGFDYNADTKIVSVSNASSTQLIEKKDFKLFVPSDMDTIFVSEIISAKPYVTVSGAVRNSNSSGDSNQSGRFIYQFVPGETVEQMLRAINAALLENSDTEGIYIIRNGERITVDYDSAFASADKGEIELVVGDEVVIPYSQQYVTVSGGVAKPGNYQYEPDKPASYYIDLAGGFTTDAQENTLKAVLSDGKVSDLQTIMPNTTITVKRRNTNAASQVSFIMSLVTLGLTIVDAIRD